MTRFWKLYLTRSNWFLTVVVGILLVVSVLFVEAAAEKPLPADYAQRTAAGRPLSDFVVVTPAIVRPDPCEAMRQRAGSKK